MVFFCPSGRNSSDATGRGRRRYDQGTGNNQLLLLHKYARVNSLSSQRDVAVLTGPV